MAGPWEAYRKAPPAQASAAAPPAKPWERYGGAAKPAEQPYSGSILPFSKDAEGNVSFDTNAGFIGAIKRAVTLPGDVYAGRVDPNSDEAIGRSLELATMAAPVGAAVRAGDRAIPGALRAVTRSKPEAPTAEQLKAAASAGYDGVRDAGVDYSATAVRDMAAGLRSALEADGILGELAPKSFAVLSKLEQPPTGSVAPIAGIEAARRSFQNAARDFNNPTDQEAARRIVARLDEFVAAADPATVVAGPASAAARQLTDARGNYAASKRSGQLTDLGEAAELRAAVTNSGQNADNATRQRLASLLLNPKAARGFDDAERSAIEDVARGSFGTNSLRATGNILGGGGGLGALLTGAIGGGTGAAAAGPIGAAVGAALPPAIGALAKGGAARLTQRGLRNVDDMTRRRSPLYEQMAAEAPMTVNDPNRRAALIRALLLSQQSGQ